MILERTIAFQDPLVLVWDEGIVKIKDMDIENELIMHALMGSLPPYEYLGMEVFLQALQNCNKAKFVQSINQFNYVLGLSYSDLMRYFAKKVQHDHALHMYVSERLGIHVYGKHKVTQRMQDWFSALEDVTVAQASFIRAMVRNNDTSPATLAKIANHKSYGKYFFEDLLENKNTSLKTRVQIILNEDFSSDPHNSKALKTFLRKWKGIFPTTYARPLLDLDQAHIDLALCKAHLEEDAQLILAKSPSRITRQNLNGNRHLTPRTKAILQGRIIKEMEL